MGPMLWVLLLGLWVPSAAGNVLEVPWEYASIHDALTASQDGDTVRLAPGTYDEVGLEALRPITLLGDPAAPESVVIDGQGLGRILHCDAAGFYRVEGITFRGGNASDLHIAQGGGLYARQPLDMRLTACRFVDCSAATGGGVAILSGQARIVDCRFEGNTGSALYCGDLPLELYGSTFVMNQGVSGGAFQQVDGSVIIDGCRFSRNGAQDGGAVKAYRILALNSVFHDNAADTGGDISCRSFEGYRCSFMVSRARLGAMVYYWGAAYLDRCIMTRGTGSGAIYFSSGYSGYLEMQCCDVFHLDGPAVVGIINEGAEETNLYGDPWLCDPRAGEYGLAPGSPCLPEGNGCGVSIGAGVLGDCAAPAVIADFLPGQEVVLAGHSMGFVDRSSPAVVSWSWDLDGNGSVDSREPFPEWSYVQPGRYSATLVACSATGCDTLTLADCVTVLGPRVLRVPEDVPDIQAALDQCQWGDTVSVACGNWPVANLRVPGRVALVSRGNEPECATLDAQGAGRVLWMSDQDSSTLVSGFRLVGGSAEGSGVSALGGAAHFDNASPTIRNCIFSGNRARHGGAVSIDGGSRPVFEHCTFADNQADFLGAAVYSPGGAGFFHNCILSRNSGGSATQGPVFLTCSDIHGNPGGDWVGNIAGLLGNHGNISADPLFCAETRNRYRLDPGSPCFDSTCGIIGANGRQCDGTDTPAPRLPVTIGLLGCYPNPFNASLHVRYATGPNDPVRIRLLDLLGREVQTWSGTGTGASGDELVLHADGLPSGVYLVQLEARGITKQVRKVLLLK